VTYVFSENREKYLGWSEASSGVGLMIGPVLGGIFYGGGIFPDETQYFWTFFVFSMIVLLSSILSFVVLPNSLNQAGMGESEQN
jgi:MFS family permease